VKPRATGEARFLGRRQDLACRGAEGFSGLRRRVAARAKRPVTLRLEEGQIAAAKRAADRMSLPYQALLRMWIAERLA
jgi:predicted DNA binding CopG/RHH family protein